MAKVNYIRLPEPGTAKIRGIGSNNAREFFVGQSCPPEWGGGRIASMEEDPARGPGVIVIRKTCRFDPTTPSETAKAFDAICVTAAQWTIVDDEKTAPEEQPKPVQDPPPAKPVQQGQQRR